MLKLKSGITPKMGLSLSLNRLISSSISCMPYPTKLHNSQWVFSIQNMDLDVPLDSSSLHIIYTRTRWQVIADIHWICQDQEPSLFNSVSFSIFKSQLNSTNSTCAKPFGFTNLSVKMVTLSTVPQLKMLLQLHYCACIVHLYLEPESSIKSQS